MTPTKSKQASHPTYTGFLRSLEPIWISLVGTQFTGDREQYFEHREHQLSVSWNAEPVNFGDDFFEVKVEAAVTLSPARSSKSFFALTATYQLHIHTSSPLNKGYVKRFTGVN
jgi:hypothetical protein